MSNFDYTTLTDRNCPWRWRIIAEYLREQKTSELDLLNSDYKAVLDWVFEKDFTNVNPPAPPRVTVESKTNNSILFNVTVLDEDATTVYRDVDTVEFGAGTPAASSNPNTETTLTSGQWEATGLTPGNYYAYRFSALDDNGEGSACSDVLVALAPPTPTTPAGATGSSTGEVDLSWDDMNGAATYDYMYLAGSQLQADVIASGASGTASTNSETATLTSTAAVAEISSVTCVADVAGSLGGKYFLISSPTVDYYVWYNTGASSDPSVASRTGIEVTITSGDTDVAVATATETALEASVFGVNRTDAILAVSNDVEGAATNAADGDAGFTVSTTTPGSDASGVLYTFIVRSTNPGGSSDWTSVFTATTHA